MTTRFLAVLLTAMLALAGVTLAQDAPASGGSSAPPNVNVQVEAPAAPAAPQVNVEAPPSTSTVTNNTSVTKESTVVEQPAESWVNPWILIGGGVALVIVLLFIAMAAGSGGKDRHTVTTVT